MKVKEVLKDNINNKEAVNLLASLLSMSSLTLKSLHLNDEVDLYSIDKFNAFLDRVKNGYPVEYATNKAYFYGLELYVNPSCLIPRDETEELVEWIIKDNLNDDIKLLDMCSGSGCIGLSLKYNRPNWNIECCDIDEGCIEVIKTNSSILDLNVKITQSDLFDKTGEFDILVANPPYISLNDKNVSDSVREYEPSRALFTNDSKGLEFYIKIFDYLKDHKFSKAYFEFGFEQKNDLEDLLKQYNFKYEFRKDINNKDRMLMIERI